MGYRVIERKLCLSFRLTDCRCDSGYGQDAIETTRAKFAVGGKAGADLKVIGICRKVGDHKDKLAGLVLLDVNF